MSRPGGAQAGALGFSRPTSIGAGLELDLDARNAWVSRARLVARHLQGDNVKGWMLGVSASF